MSTSSPDPDPQSPVVPGAPPQPQPDTEPAPDTGQHTEPETRPGPDPDAIPEPAGLNDDEELDVDQPRDDPETHIG